LHVPVAQREGKIQPNRIANDFSWETITGVHGQVVDRSAERVSQILLSAVIPLT
jgi:hypothetical protein